MPGWAKGLPKETDPRVARYALAHVGIKPQRRKPPELDGRSRSWAKGLTKQTDPRIARNAASHLGMRYKRRTPVEQCRWRRGFTRNGPLGWTNELAYAVGLLATDGCLLTRRRQIAFTSKDYELVAVFMDCVGHHVKVHTKRGERGSLAFQVQFKDIELYDWFERCGLTPRKSLSLGPITVPDDYFFHMVRGLLDGDGSIAHYVHRAIKKHDPTYVYERLNICFHSASRQHLEWLRQRL